MAIKMVQTKKTEVVRLGKFTCRCTKNQKKKIQLIKKQFKSKYFKEVLKVIKNGKQKR